MIKHGNFFKILCPEDYNHFEFAPAIMVSTKSHRSAHDDWSMTGTKTDGKARNLHGLDIHFPLTSDKFISLQNEFIQHCRKLVAITESVKPYYTETDIDYPPVCNSQPYTGISFYEKQSGVKDDTTEQKDTISR